MRSSIRTRARWPRSSRTWGSPLPSDALTVPAGRARARSLRPPVPWGSAASGGAAVAWLTVIVLLPLAAVAAKSLAEGPAVFWDAISGRRAVSALELTVFSSAIVAAIDMVMGTLIAWVLVRDEFRGRAVVNALVDLPFALPTIVAGLTLLALYGPNGPAPFDVGFTRVGILFALLFV